MDDPLKTSQLTGFLLKRKKSESRSITPNSENSYSMNKEPALPKFSWAEAKSLFYQSEQWMEEQKIVKLLAASDSLIVWFRRAESTGQQELGSDCPFGLVCLFGYGSKEALYTHPFSEPILMVESSDSFQPACVLTKNQLCIPSFGVDQNQLVHKVIMYENAALAESLCHINHWDHCVIPLEALQVALKHRQLDTVAFFLKTQENVFTSSTALPLPSPSSTTLSPQFPSPSPSSTTLPVTMDIQQTEHVINALVKSVKKNAKQHHNLHFTSQLLQMTLTYLHSLLEDGTRFIEKNKPDTTTAVSQDTLGSPDLKQPAMVSAVEDCLMFVTESIVELRRYLGNIPEKNDIDDVDGGDREMAFDDVDGGSQDVFEKWKTMDCKEVIRDAVISGNIGTAQAYFLSNKSQGEVRCDGSLSSITTTGLEIMLTSLVNQDIDTAIRIITNLGRDPVEQLHTLCFNTLHQPLRDFLISELDAKGHLMKNEKEMLQFMEALENLYNTQSFEMAKKGLTSQTDSWTDLGILKNTFNLSSTRVLETNVRTGSLLQGHSHEQMPETCGGYSEVLLEWVQAWNDEARQCILLERILSDKDTTKNSFPISPQALWHYFASRGDWRTMRSWVRAMTSAANPSPDDPVVSISDALAIHEGGLVLPPLTRDVFSQFPACPAVIKEVIVDELTRYGLFTTEELSNFNILLHHLCRTQTLFTEPHPLHGMRTQHQPSDEEQIPDDGPAGQIVSLADFHHRFIDYCIRMQFVNLLYHYLDYYGLGESLEAVLMLKVESDKPAWFDMLISFRLAGKHPEDKDSVFRASLSNARMILQTTSPSITAMLNEGCPIMALATLVYGPGYISQAIVSADRSLDNPTWQVQETLLRRSLSSHPKLLTALFPVMTSVDGMEPQDITVYQLLQGNSPLEISRMFGWQSTNELALKADMVCEMPNFSLAPLVSQYSHQEHLTYSYYLRHGRPSFAFAAFVGSQLTELCVTRSRILTASKKAYRVAIQHFTDTQITTACVVFNEMLGLDSTGLRVDIQAANRVLSHAGRESFQGTDGRNGKALKDKIVSELLSRGTRQVSMLLAALEEATFNLISKDCLERSSFESSHHWTLVLMFCRVHKMDLSTAYLIDCAKADKWLPFVCFAQVGQYPKHQVLEVIEDHFCNRHIKEHLCLAFENVQTIQVEVASDESSRKRRRKRQATKKDVAAQVVTPTKDIRAQFYSRMGFKKGGSLGSEGPTCPHSSSAEEDEVKTKSKEKKSSEKDSSSATDGTVTAEERPGTSSRTATDSHERALDPNNLPDNLFDVLFSCESAHVPWRSLLAHAIALHRPLFAVLAACYEESKPLDCICAWLYSTLKPEILFEAAHNIPVVEWHRWTGQDLTGIITAVVKYKEKYAVSLAKAFYIFDPTSPMLRFLRFYESFVVHVDFDNCQKQLDLFKKSYSKLTMRGSSVSQSLVNITHDLRWIEEVTSLVTQQMVHQCGSTYEQGHLLSLLAKTMLGRNFSFKIPNYYKLHKINEVLQDTKVVADFAQMLDENSKASKDEIQHVLQSLLAHKYFSQAREYADLLDLPQDPITLKEVLHERESIENSVLWEIKQGRLAFWHKANECFKSNRCNAKIAASFFETQAEDDDLTFTEKSRLLSMALQWYSRTDPTGHKQSSQKEELSKLEKRIWLCSIRAEMEKNREVRFARSVSHLEFLPSSSDWDVGLPINPPSGHTIQGADTNELIQSESFDTSMSTDGTILTSEEEFSALERVIGELLEGCHVTKARRLAAHFDYTSQDLTIILSCIYLAQATRFVDTLDEPIRKILYQTPHRRMSVSGSGSNLEGIKRSGSFVLSTSLTDSVGRGADDSISVDWVQVEDTITAMETLTYHCKKGKKCCTRITTCYKIAQTLGLEYESVVTDKPFNVLHSLLVSGFDSRYKLADSYIKAFDLSSDEVVGFLKDIILLSLRVYCGEELSNGENELIFNAAPSCDDVIQVIRLCSDQALLGNRLLETAASVAHDRVSGTGSNKALQLEVELLVRAHECHTIACNMEGITSVLKCGRQLTAALADSEEYRLMVRLLTGIGRFREMSYIFDTLLRHHHFELLCQRGIDKENKLKVALLEYLKRCHPDDDEKYKIVAMHFSMYREIADTWKTSATSQIKGLKDQQMTAKPELQSKLTSIMNSFKYATDYYTKEGCFQHSQKCLKYARLVQLQIHLLPSGIRVINLDERGLKQFLSKHNHFFEALLVVDAYEKRGTNLWISAIYYHVVVAGDFKYWQDLRSVMSPASVLFVDVANKFKNTDNSQSPQVIQNMKKLLTYLPELRVRYRIATDLGFRDVSSAILEGDGGAYLRDIMHT